MSIKDWTTNYPISLDSEIEMPDVVNGTDITRASQILAARDAIIQLETFVGSDIKEPGSLAATMSGVENTVQTFPPSSPGTYDDEFSGTSLDAKWSWNCAGVPNATGEEYAVENGMFNITITGDGGGMALETNCHVMEQDIPDIDTDWRVSIQVSAWVKEANNRVGIILHDGSEDISNLFDFVYRHSGDVYNSGFSMDYRIGDAWAWWDTDTLPNYVAGQTIIMGIRNDSATDTFHPGISYDGKRWAEQKWTQYDYGTDAWTPSKVGLMFWTDAGTSSDLLIAHVHWFRVTNL